MSKKRKTSPTMQDIADELGISRVSVWKVFENKPGVSDYLRDSVIEKAKEVGYTKRSILGANQDNGNNGKTIGLVVSRPESASFWMNIVHSLAKELAEQHVNLLYIYVPSTWSANYTLPEVLTNGSVQGFIVMNLYDAKMTLMLDALTLPKIFLDLPDAILPNDIKGDLVFFEGVNTVEEICFYLIDQGKKELGFIGDIHYAHTNHDRYRGFLRALNTRGLEPFEGAVLIESLGIHTVEEKVIDFLESIKNMPQAFVCANDHLAYFVSKYLLENQKRIGKEVVIAGYDGMANYGDIQGMVVTATVNTSSIGRRLARKILFLTAYPNGDKEMSYIRPPMTIRQETKER